MENNPQKLQELLDFIKLQNEQSSKNEDSSFFNLENILPAGAISAAIKKPTDLAKYANVDIKPIYTNQTEEFLSKIKNLSPELLDTTALRKLLKLGGGIAAASEYADSRSAFDKMLDKNLNWKQRTGAGLKGLGGSLGLGGAATEVLSGGAATPVAIPTLLAGAGLAGLGEGIERWGNQDAPPIKLPEQKKQEPVKLEQPKSENEEMPDSEDYSDVNDEYSGETNQEARQKLLDIKQQLRQQKDVESEEIPEEPSQIGLNEQILEALRAKGESQSTANMLRAVQMMSSALSGMDSKVVAQNKSDQFFKDLLEQSSKPIEDLSTRLQLEEYDPNSPAAKNMRDYLNSTLEMAGLEKVNLSGMNLKQMEKLASSISSLGYHMGMAKEKGEIRRQEGLIKQEAKQIESDTKRFDKLSKELDPSRASGRSQLGIDARNVAVIENAMTLLKTGDLNNLDTRQVYEAVRLLDRVVSGGNPTISASQHLQPETYRAQFSKFMEKLTNIRRGAGAESFLKSTIDTFQRELQTAKKRLERSALSAASSYKDLIQRNPEKWNEIMQDQGYSHLLSTDVLNKIKQEKSEKKPETKNEIERLDPKTGKTAIFDADTKTFIRWK